MALKQRTRQGLATSPPLASRGSFGARSLARLVDLAILVITGFAIGIVVILPTQLVAGAEAASTAAALVNFVAMLIGIAYFVYCWRRYGATLGQRLLGLRVVNDRGDRLSWRQAIGRYLAQFIPLVAFVLVYFTISPQLLGGLIWVLSLLPFALGYLWALGSQRRTWHDVLADTYVIRRQ